MIVVGKIFLEIMILRLGKVEIFSLEIKYQQRVVLKMLFLEMDNAEIQKIVLF